MSRLSVLLLALVVLLAVSVSASSMRLRSRVQVANTAAAAVAAQVEAEAELEVEHGVSFGDALDAEQLAEQEAMLMLDAESDAEADMEAEVDAESDSESDAELDAEVEMDTQLVENGQLPAPAGGNSNGTSPLGKIPTIYVNNSADANPHTGPRIRVTARDINSTKVRIGNPSKADVASRPDNRFWRTPANTGDIFLPMRISRPEEDQDQHAKIAPSYCYPYTESAKALADLINLARNSSNIANLTLDEDLTQNAKRMNLLNVRYSALAHTTPREFGFRVRGWSTMGELVAVQPNIGSVFSAWRASEGHNFALMNRDYTRFGVHTETASGMVWATVILTGKGNPSTTLALDHC